MPAVLCAVAAFREEVDSAISAYYSRQTGESLSSVACKASFLVKEKQGAYKLGTLQAANKTRLTAI